MNESQFERLLRLVLQTEDEELSCTACFELLPLYVDLDVSGQAPDVCLPLFRRHLVQCAVCREEYETVRELARREAEGRSPSIHDLRRPL